MLDLKISTVLKCTMMRASFAHFDEQRYAVPTRSKTKRCRDTLPLCFLAAAASQIKNRPHVMLKARVAIEHGHAAKKATYAT
eukprot:6190193-Pleurochrysis_carterae.AAC.2